MQNLTKDRLLPFGKALPYIFISGVGIALILTAALGRPDLAARGSYLAIPAILVALIAIPRDSRIKESLIATSARLHLSSRSFLRVTLIFVVLYLISFCLLIGSELKPLPYFCLIAIMSGLIFVEILSTEQTHSGRKVIILLQIVLLSLNFIFGQTLKLPLYFGGGGDVLFHMRFVDAIVESGHVTAAMGGYQQFPLFHILGANGTLLTGLDPQTSYFLLGGLAFIISVPLVYLLVSQATKDIHLPLVAALIYSQSQVFLFGGMYICPRNIAFVLFLLTLHLLIQGRKRLCFGIIAVALVPALVFMHQITLAYISATLLVLIIIELLLYRRPNYIGYTYLIIFTVAYLAYWHYTGALSYAVTTVSPEIAAPPPGVAPPPEYGHLRGPLGLIWIPPAARVPQEPIIVSALRYADFSILAFMVVLGIVSQLYKRGKENPSGTTFALLALVAFPFYFPGPLTLFPTLFLLMRLTILVSPFIVFAAAEGILALTRRSIHGQRLKSTAVFALSLLLIPLLSFFSATILANEPDLNIGKIVSTHSRSYYTEAELTSFSFVTKYRGELGVYSDYYTQRYFTGYANIPTISSMNISNTSLINEGYFLLRREELESRGQLVFLTGTTIGFWPEPYTYRADHASSIEVMLEERDKIFDNNAVQIYYLQHEKKWPS